MNCDSDVAYKRTKGARQAVSYWVSNPKDYQMYLDGTHLLMEYYAWDDILKADYWTLLEVYRRWASIIEASLFFGNRYQIENFVPLAQERVNEILNQMVATKKKVNHRQIERPKNWRLDAKQVKIDVDPIKVFEYYLPDMKKSGSVYKAKCLWHNDSNPSFVVYQDGSAHCFVCGAHHDVFSVVMDLEKCDFATSVARVAEFI